MTSLQVAQKDKELVQTHEQLESQRVEAKNLTRQLEKERKELEEAILETQEQAEIEKNHRENIEKELSAVQQRLQDTLAERSLEQQRHAECLSELQLKVKLF